MLGKENAVSVLRVYNHYWLAYKNTNLTEALNKYIFYLKDNILS